MAESTNRMKIIWDAVEGADYYQVWRLDSKNATPGTCIGVHESWDTIAISYNLKAGRTYYYRVRAYKVVDGKKIFGSYSPTVSGTTIAVPDKPTGVRAKAISSTAITVSWNKAAGADYYQLWETDYNSYWGRCIGVYDANTFSATHRNLIPGNIYHYFVRAYRIERGRRWYGDGSAIVEEYTLVSKPSQPKVVMAEALGPTSVSVSWYSVSDADFYQVWRMDSQNSTPGVCIGVYDRKTTSCVSRNLQPGRAYYYRVRAYAKNGSARRTYGDYGPTAKATTLSVPPAPGYVYVKATGSNTTEVSWYSVPGADFYQVWRMDNQNSAPGACIGIYDRKTTSCVSRNLQPGRAYYYRVRAYAKSGSARYYGDYTNIVSTSTYDDSGNPTHSHNMEYNVSHIEMRGCTQDAETDHVCSCGDTLCYIEASAPGHDWQPVYQEYTHTFVERTIERCICNQCGKDITDELINDVYDHFGRSGYARGCGGWHTYWAPVVGSETTQEIVGYQCARCGEKVPPDKVA